jgi:hypothetical protein
MSNLAELYHPYLRFNELELGMQLKISKVSNSAKREHLKGNVGDIVKIIELSECDADSCSECLTHNKFIATTRNGSTKRVTNCFFELSDFRGRPISYE